MAKIRQLSEDMIGKIAAGEVVERPAAAIKELVENSLDAGATAVTVEIREGGLSYIRVADNGSGIDGSDIRMAFERHATSKISREQDLLSISTLGFRGEALASIAAVSRVTMSTRTAAAETGIKVRNEGGRIADLSETACPVGTTVIVNDLFYNVPVRKGFMKKAGQEAAAVSELMMQMILSRPDVSIRFISNGKTEYHSPGDGQLLSALHSVYGGQTVRAMREVDGHGSGMVIRGYVGIGECARGNRNHELFFINGRVMHSRILSEAVERAVRERVMIGKFPICALHITIAYDAVDVNVHPNKLEVRFRDESAVQEALFTTVFEALRDRDAFERPVEMTLEKDKKEAVNVTRPTVIRAPAAATVSVSKTLPAEAAVKAGMEKPAPRLMERQPVSSVYNEKTGTGETRPPAAEELKGTATPAKTFPESIQALPEKAEQVSTILPEVKKPMTIFGALFHTYILVEYEDQLLMIDQHAVHERLLFDRLMEQYGSGQQAGQELLVPIVIGVTNQEQRLLEDNRDALESIGMSVEAFGERDIAVRSIPMILGEAQTKDFVHDVVAELENGRDPTFEKKRSALLQTACKHAVKGGEPLDEDQLRSLLDTMIEKKVTPTCPHGRPLVVAISHRDLDKKFKRIQQ